MERKLSIAGRLVVALVIFSFSAPAAASRPLEHIARADAQRGWIVRFDNDLFAFTRQDRDYTAGIAVTLGSDDSPVARPLSRTLDWLDRRSGFAPPPRGGDETVRSFEAGLLLFTPRDLAAAEPLPEDRPYANLAYLSTSRLVHHPDLPVAHQSSLTLGLLGSPFVAELHRGLHAALGNQTPMGYEHQISEGGEPTLRYALSRYRLLDHGSFAERPYQLRLGLTGSVGYLTEASAELAVRWGNLHTPWWSSSPSVSDYAAHPLIRLVGAGGDANDGPRFHLTAGVNVRLRAYNSFLQGQLRSSDVTHPSSHLNRVLVEGWVGLTTVFGNNLSVNYTLRHQTPELRTDAGARDVTWASIAVSQQF